MLLNHRVSFKTFSQIIYTNVLIKYKINNIKYVKTSNRLNHLCKIVVVNSLLYNKTKTIFIINQDKLK